MTTKAQSFDSQAVIRANIALNSQFDSACPIAMLRSRQSFCLRQH